MNVDGAGAARQRRERRLRSLLVHDRQTVAMELAAALHHSRDARPNVTHNAPRGTDDGKLRDAAVLTLSRRKRQSRSVTWLPGLLSWWCRRCVALTRRRNHCLPPPDGSAHEEEKEEE